MRRPLPARALLDAAEADRSVAEALWAKGEPFLMKQRVAAEAKGRAEGTKEGLIRGIELALELKLGAAGLALLPEIQAVDDVQTMLRVHAAILTARDLDEVRRALAST